MKKILLMLTATLPAFCESGCCCSCDTRNDISISVNFLYWFGKETGLCYAQRNETIELSPVMSSGNNIAPFVVAPREFKWIEESWDPGVRVGLGWSGACTGWDLYSSWTYFCTKKRHSTSVSKFSLSSNNFPLEESLHSPWIYPELSPGTTSSLDSFNRIRAKWRLSSNVWDLELGRECWWGPCFSFRPYIGLRGGWIKTKLTTQPILDFSTSSPSGTTTVFGIHQINYTNRFWGVGLLGGLQPNWHFGCGVSLFGNVDGALLWGCFNNKRREQAEIKITSPFISIDEIEPLGTSKSRFSHLQGILDLAIGLRWETTYCCDRYGLAIDLGWEHHLWFDHNHKIQLRGQFSQPNISGQQSGISFVDFDETYGNLVLGGLVVRAQFDF